MSVPFGTRGQREAGLQKALRKKIERGREILSRGIPEAVLEATRVPLAGSLWKWSKETRPLSRAELRTVPGDKFINAFPIAPL